MRAIDKMTRSRGMLDELRGEHTYGVNTGFGRFVSESIPDEQAEELQLRLLRSHACGVGEPYPDEVVRAAMLLRANAIAKGYSGARVRDGRAAARRCSRSGIVPLRPGARIGRRERRPRAPRASGAAARRRGRGVPRRRGGCRARRRSRRRPAAGPAPGEGGALAHQRHPVHVRDGVARAREGATARARRRHRVLDVARGAAGLAHELPSRHPRRATARGPGGLGRERARAARRLGDPRVAPLVRQGAGRVLAALRRAGARRQPGSPRLRRADDRDRDQRRDRQSARAARRARDRLERELPRAARRLRPRQPRARGGRAREHLGAARRAHGQPEPLRRPAGLPHARGRDQLGDDDPAVRVGRARLREQGARPPGERRLDPDERRAGGSRLDGERRRPEGDAGDRERRALARDRADRRGAGGRVPRAARARPRRRRGAGARAHALGAAARGQVAVGRHRARGRRRSGTAA